MAADYTEQWRPFPQEMTQGNDALSLAAARYLALAANNAKAYACAQPWRAPMSFFQADGVGGTHNPWAAIAATTDELIVRYFAAAPIPLGYTKIRWHVGHERTAGAGTVTWRLYLGELFFDGTTGVSGGDHRMDTTRLGAYASDSTGFISDSTAHVMDDAPRDIDVASIAGLTVFGYLTAQLSETSATTGQVSFFSAYPRLE